MRYRVLGGSTGLRVSEMALGTEEFGLGAHPAWKVARAATLAELRGWAPPAAITIEYGASEREAERELLLAAEAPAARPDRRRRRSSTERAPRARHRQRPAPGGRRLPPADRPGSLIRTMSRGGPDR
ncbi:hypothetical protein BJ973_000210 [Actinoplanes tereljensis]|nr:hypothetical protein [Actinoplanes tereljensis]